MTQNVQFEFQSQIKCFKNTLPLFENRQVCIWPKTDTVFTTKENWTKKFRSRKDSEMYES